MAIRFRTGIAAFISSSRFYILAPLAPPSALSVISPLQRILIDQSYHSTRRKEIRNYLFTDDYPSEHS